MQTLEEIKQDNQWSFFSKSDPFNNNAVDGYISHHADDRYGALYITAVNGKEVPQYILCTPKLHYPFDKNGKYNWPKASRIERYVKYDGTNIFAFNYHNAAGNNFVSFKTRLMPFIGDTKNGPFLSMWREMLKEEPELSTIALYTGLDIAYELFGARNPHLIKYDVPLTAKVLFARHVLGGILPPTDLLEVPTKFCAELRGIITKDNYTEEYEKAQQEAQSKLKEVGEYIEGDEGEVWYLDVEDTWYMVKMKPEMIEQIHWAAGGIGKNIIVATCENSFENWDNPTVDNIVELLKEEFTPAEVDKVYYRIEKYLDDVKLRHEFRVGVLTKYQECGINITTDKISVMRAMSKIFPKEKMSQVYDIITHIK